MANNLNAFQTELLALLTTTVNLDSATKTKLRNRIVTIRAYSHQWSVRVASGTTDNAANRGAFLAEKMVEFLKDIYLAGSSAENVAAMPVTEILS